MILNNLSILSSFAILRSFISYGASLRSLINDVSNEPAAKSCSFASIARKLKPYDQANIQIYGSDEIRSTQNHLSK